MKKKKKESKNLFLLFFTSFWFLLKKTFGQFMEDNAMKLSASLSYYTVFSLGPLLVIIISLCGFFFGSDAVQGEIFAQLRGLLGADTALQIQEIIKNTKLADENIIATVIGVFVLLLSASGVFSEMQDSINFIWGLRAKPKRGLIKMLKNRLISVSMIGSVGFLLLVALIVNTLLDILSDKLSSYFPGYPVFLFYAFNVIIVFVIITLLFGIIFKTLPDGKVDLKDALIGASFTAVLFMLGKLGIGLYLGNSDLASTYGTAASIIIVLVWVYYSAIILYFGAEFTRAYAYSFGEKIIPNSYAIQINKEIVDEKPQPAG